MAAANDAEARFFELYDTYLQEITDACNDLNCALILPDIQYTKAGTNKWAYGRVTMYTPTNIRHLPQTLADFDGSQWIYDSRQEAYLAAFAKLAEVLKQARSDREFREIERRAAAGFSERRQKAAAREAEIRARLEAKTKETEKEDKYPDDKNPEQDNQERDY